MIPDLRSFLVNQPLLSLFRRKLILGCAANWTDPIFGQLFKSDACLNSRLGVTHFRIINITANTAYIPSHDHPSLLE